MTKHQRGRYKTFSEERSWITIINKNKIATTIVTNSAETMEEEEETKGMGLEASQETDSEQDACFYVLHTALESVYSKIRFTRSTI